MPSRLSLSLAILTTAACESASAAPDAAVVTDAPRPDVVEADVAAEPDVPTPADAPRVIEPCDAGAGDGGIVVRGRAYNFGPTGGASLRGAVIRVLEHPERCVTLGDSNDFSFGGFVAGEPVSLTMDHPDYVPIQTGTHSVPSTGITGITFQAPTWGIYRLMATAAREVPQGDRCQIAATVTALGLSIDSPTPSHGEAGATVTIEPDPGDAVGPIYFNYYGPGSILPDRALRETTRDGGVLWLNVRPGEYVLTAHKAGVNITQARFRCRAGVLVNASPPMGLQVVP
ncbi:MAG: hypothetical protein R3A48_01335 [Polyangiales bacterium]